MAICMAVITKLILVIIILIVNAVILTFTFITKKGLYTVTPEKQWADILNEFDKNFKAIKKIKISNFKLGFGHLYRED